MTNTKKKFAAILFVISICLSACVRSPETPSTLDGTTTPQGTTAPLETTSVPPTTEEPHVELTREVIFQMLDNATKLLETCETITLPAYQYTREFVGYTELESKGIVAMSNDNITICNTKDADNLYQLRFLVCFTDLIERFGEYSCMWYVYDSYGSLNVSALAFYTEYEEAGYESVEAFVNEGGLWVDQGPNSSYFLILFDSSEPEIKETHFYIEDGMKYHVGHHTYCKDPAFSDYHKYLQSKGEG